MTDDEMIEKTRAGWLRLGKHPATPAIYEAADHIEKLEADNARLREAMKGPLAWLERWAVHVGNCKGDSACTCGLTFVQHELRAALQETSHDRD